MLNNKAKHMIHNKFFTKKQIAETAGLTPRQVQFYVEEGIITPDVDSGRGRGNVRKYSRKNLLEFMLVKTLSDYKIGISQIREILTYLRDHERSPLDIPEIYNEPPLYLTVCRKDGDIIYKIQNFIYADYEMKEICEQAVLIINLSLINQP